MKTRAWRSGLAAAVVFSTTALTGIGVLGAPSPASAAASNIVAVQVLGGVTLDSRETAPLCVPGYVNTFGSGPAIDNIQGFIGDFTAGSSSFNGQVNLSNGIEAHVLSCVGGSEDVLVSYGCIDTTSFSGTGGTPAASVSGDINAVDNSVNDPSAIAGPCDKTITLPNNTTEKVFGGFYYSVGAEAIAQLASVNYTIGSSSASVPCTAVIQAGVWGVNPTKEEVTGPVVGQS